MAFKPRIFYCKLEDEVDSTAQGGKTDVPEVLEFWVREPSGREILSAIPRGDGKAKEKEAIENARDLYTKYVVHEDGSASTKEEVEGFLDMRLEMMHRMSQMIQEKIGLNKVTAGAAKNA